MNLIIQQNLSLFEDTFFMVYGAMYQEYAMKCNSLQQRHSSGHINMPQTFQGSAVMFLWVAMLTFLVQAYQSNLKASLVVKTHERQIGSLQEMVEK